MSCAEAKKGLWMGCLWVVLAMVKCCRQWFSRRFCYVEGPRSS